MHGRKEGGLSGRQQTHSSKDGEGDSVPSAPAAAAAAPRRPRGRPLPPQALKGQKCEPCRNFPRGPRWSLTGPFPAPLAPTTGSSALPGPGRQLAAAGLPGSPHREGGRRLVPRLQAAESVGNLGVEEESERAQLDNWGRKTRGGGGGEKETCVRRGGCVGGTHEGRETHPDGVDGEGERGKAGGEGEGRAPEDAPLANSAG